MRYLHLLARTILPYRLLYWWYKLTLGESFVGIYDRIPIFKSNNLVEEANG